MVVNSGTSFFCLFLFLEKLNLDLHKCLIMIEKNVNVLNVNVKGVFFGPNGCNIFMLLKIIAAQNAPAP